jgi:hypothetical protein
LKAIVDVLPSVEWPKVVCVAEFFCHCGDLCFHFFFVVTVEGLDEVRFCDDFCFVGAVPFTTDDASEIDDLLDDVGEVGLGCNSKPDGDMLDETVLANST